MTDSQTNTSVEQLQRKQCGTGLARAAHPNSRWVPLSVATRSQR